MIIYINNARIPTIDIIEFDPSTENKFNKHQILMVTIWITLIKIL